MMGWFTRWRDRRLHLWAFVYWGVNVAHLFSDLHEAIEFGDAGRREKIGRRLDEIAKSVYLKGRFHVHRGPDKLYWFRAWLRHADTTDPLGLLETPEQRRVKWGEED